MQVNTERSTTTASLSTASFSWRCTPFLRQAARANPDFHDVLKADYALAGLWEGYVHSKVLNWKLCSSTGFLVVFVFADIRNERLQQVLRGLRAHNEKVAVA